MAKRYFGVERNKTEFSVTQGSSTTSKGVEAVVDLSKSLNKGDVILLLKQIRERMYRSSWPPAASTAYKYAWGMNRGQNYGNVSEASPVGATATVTAASVLESDTVTVNGVALTAQDLREKSQVDTVADSGGSLNNKYFLLSSPTVNYYVWFNINSAGTDPALAGKTGIQVTAATNRSANNLATDIATAVAAVGSSLIFSASASTNHVTITALATGVAAAAADGNTTGFTFTELRVGAVTPGAAKFSMNGADGVVAASLAAAVNLASTDATAVAALAVVTLTAVVRGTAGNSLTLATSNNSRLAKSGTTFSGGAEALATTDVVIAVRMDEHFSRLDALLAVDYLSGAIFKNIWPPA